MAKKVLFYTIPGAIYASPGVELAAGDEATIFLNQERNSNFPESIAAIVQAVTPVTTYEGTCPTAGRQYAIEYEVNDLDDAVTTLSDCDVVTISGTSCCELLRTALDEEIAARAAADTALGVRIGGVEDDLDTWDVVSEGTADLPLQGTAGVPQVVTQTVVGTVTTGGFLLVQAVGADFGGTIEIEVDVDSGDVPSVSAAKIAAALGAHPIISDFYTASNIGADYALTEIVPNGNDGTLSLKHALAGSTATGVTQDLVATNTVAGIAEVEGTDADRVGQHFHTSDERIFEATDTSPNHWRELTTDLTSINARAALTGLTGGGVTKLDGLVVSSSDSGRTQFVSDSNIGYFYILKPGTAAENSPYIIRPDNYSVSNQYVWELSSAATVSNAILDATEGGNGSVDEFKVHKFKENGVATFNALIQSKNVGGFIAEVSSAGLTANRSFSQPNASGTYALIRMVTLSTPLTGATTTVNTGTLDEFVYITPAGTIATHALTLPAAANSRVGQKVEFQSSQIVTALTVSAAGGGSVVGTALTAAAANISYEYICTAAGTWLRIR